MSSEVLDKHVYSHRLIKDFAFLVHLKPQLNTVTIQAPIHHDSSRFETDGKIGLYRDVSVWKKRNSSINTMSHDAPTVSARFIYGPTTTHDGSATIHHGGATNAHDASTMIRYGATCTCSTIQAGSATVASRPLHDLVVFIRQSQGVGGGVGSGPASTVHPPPPKKKKTNKKKQQEFQEPPKIFEILATPKNHTHSVP